VNSTAIGMSAGMRIPRQRWIICAICHIVVRDLW
jgi:hypothetical protein